LPGACARNGHDVRTAPDGEEAMAIMAGQDFDVVISDHHFMPESWYRTAPQGACAPTAETLRPDHRLRHGGDGRRGASRGRSDYIVKPFKFDELRLRVRGCSSTRRRLRNRRCFSPGRGESVPDRSLLGERHHACSPDSGSPERSGRENVPITARAAPQGAGRPGDHAASPRADNRSFQSTAEHPGRCVLEELASRSRVRMAPQ